MGGDANLARSAQGATSEWREQAANSVWLAHAADAAKVEGSKDVVERQERWQRGKLGRLWPTPVKV